MACYMAKDVIAAIFIYVLTATIRCHDTSEDLTNTSQLTEATTTEFVEDSSDAGSAAQRAAIKSDAQFINGSFCRQAYSCHFASAPKVASLVLGCSCQDYCALYGDCCSDKVSIPPSSEPIRLPRASYACAPRILFQHSVYMITECPASYDDLSVAESCSNFTDFSTPSMDIHWTPVTDVVTGTTFRNVHCAICWGKTWRSIATWLWKLTCPEAVHEINKRETGSNSGTTASYSNSDLSGGSSAINYIRSACRLTFEPPALNASLHFCKDEAIGDCGITSSIADLDESLVSACLNGSAGYVYDNSGSVYWNAECARCRLWPDEPTVSCQPTRSRPVDDTGSGVPSLSLSIILTPDSGDCTAAANSLSSNEGWTPDLLCRGLLGSQSDDSVGWMPGCQSKRLSLCDDPAAAFSGSVIGGTCTALASESFRVCTFIDSPLSDTTTARARSSAWLNSSADGCAVLAVTLTDNTTLCYLCTAEQYDKYTVVNRSLVVNSSSGVLHQSFDYPMYVVEEGLATVCTSVLPLNRGTTASVEDGCAAVPAFVSALLLCLSEAAIIVFVAAFARVKALRRFPGEMVLNESAAFFVAFLFFLVRPLLDSAPAACTAVAVLVHYFLLSAFAWTALYSTEIASALSFRVSEGVSKRRRALHYGLAWCVPLIFVAVGLGADARALEFRPHYGPPQCFIGSRLGNLTLFMAPLCIFLTVDIFVYVYMIVKLAIIARQTSSVRSSHREKLWLSVKLVLSMGLLWLFAVLASFTQSEALYCVFSLVNALQGVFVFAVFVCKRDVMVALGRKFKASTTATTSAFLSSGARSTTSTVSS